jgi:hypothetical protein
MRINSQPAGSSDFVIRINGSEGHEPRSSTYKTSGGWRLAWNGVDLEPKSATVHAATRR